MRRFFYLLIAIIGNALGTALMSQTNIGMTAWGSSALNISNYFGFSIGTGFVILSIVFYIIATLIRKKFILKELLQSFIFLFSFAIFTDIFISYMPSFENLSYLLILLLNILGLLILLFSIAVHLKVNIAVHPMDVYLKVLQDRFNSVSKGTYIAYFSAFSVGVLFGLFHGSIDGIREGTFITLLASGLILKFYNENILDRWIW